jgi:hypothetical protein
MFAFVSWRRHGEDSGIDAILLIYIDLTQVLSIHHFVNITNQLQRQRIVRVSLVVGDE